MIIGSAIAPHGSLILPDSLDSASKAHKIHAAMNELSKHIEELKPDIIYLSTPHGVALERSFGFYKNSLASGSADWHGDYTKYSISLQLDLENTIKLIQKLQAENHDVQSITAHSESEPMYLRWGEVVPNWFLSDIKAKYIIMCQPSRRLDHSQEMVVELQELGKGIASYLDSLKERVFVLISGDMAHTYLADGPYGIDPTAELFDKAVEKWVKTLDESYLVKEANSMIYTAKSCGFTGYIMLDALLKTLGKTISTNVLVHEHPTYYGMMVATFNIE